MSQLLHVVVVGLLAAFLLYLMFTREKGGGLRVYVESRRIYFRVLTAVLVVVEMCLIAILIVKMIKD